MTATSSAGSAAPTSSAPRAKVEVTPPEFAFPIHPRFDNFFDN